MSVNRARLSAPQRTAVASRGVVAARVPAPIFAKRAAVVVRAEAEEAVAEEAAPAEEASTSEPQISTYVEEMDPSLQAAPAEFQLNFLWMDKNIAVAVDQVFAKGQKSPVTEYFFWPRMDAWEELRAALESRPWIDERSKILLLNKTTEVINYWQDEETTHTIADATAKFEECSFRGSSA